MKFKKILSIVLSATLLFSLTACSSGSTEEKQPDTNKESATEEPEVEAEKAEQTVLKVGIPTAPPALPILRMMESQALGENVSIEIEIWNEPETLIAMVQDPSFDYFAFPLTVVSTLFNKGMDVRLMNVNTWGVNYFLTSDPDFKTWSDLKGKTIYIPLQSSPPDALTQYFLDEAGLVVGEDVEIIYASPAEVAAMVSSGEATYATMFEPQVTMALSKNPDMRIALDIEDEWMRVNDTESIVPNAGFGTTQTTIDENPELTAQFNQAYEEALQWCIENPEEIGALAEKHLGLPAKVITKAIPTMGLTYKTAVDADYELDMFYEMLNEFDPKMIGGKLPTEEMYYVE